jgi:zinc protease
MYGMRYLGEEKTVASLKRDDLVNFYRSYSGANNMVIAISGDIEKDRVIEKVRESLIGVARKDTILPEALPVKIDTLKSKVIEMKKEESLALMGFITTSVRDEDRYALDVLCSVLSGYSGRLFTNLRDRSPLAYALGCDQKLAKDTGYLVLHVATTKDKMSDTRKALITEIGNIRDRAVDENELIRAKRELATRYEISLQANGFVASQSAMDELCGLGQDNLFKYVLKIEKVTAEDVKRVAVKYLDLERYADVVIISE